MAKTTIKAMGAHPALCENRKITIFLYPTLKCFRSIRRKDGKGFVLHVPALMINGFAPLSKVSVQPASCPELNSHFILIGLNEPFEPKKIDSAGIE